MPKRRSEDEEERRRRKIRRLEEKLQKYKTKDNNALPDNALNLEIDSNSMLSVDIEPPVLPQNENLEELDSEILPEMEAESGSDLPMDILEALGEDSTQLKLYGPEVHRDILKKMDGVLLRGLSKEHKDTLMKGNLIPLNGKLLDAPKLNTELMSVLNPNTKNRDKLLEGRQQELGVATAGIIYSIDNLSKQEYSKVNIVKTLGEASRLLCNLHNEYTNMRRKLIAPHMDKGLSMNLKENERSEFLYNKLEDTVKSVSVMKRASNVLKAKNTAKNYYPPPRRPFQGPQVRPPTRGGYQPSYQPRYQSNAAYRPPPRGPPRRPPPAPVATSTRGRAKYP